MSRLFLVGIIVLGLTFAAHVFSGHTVLGLFASLMVAGIIGLSVTQLKQERSKLKSVKSEADKAYKSLATVKNEKQDLMAEIDQRMKSNIQTVIGLTNFACRRVKSGEDESLAAFGGLKGRLGALASVQRVLGSWRNTDTVPAHLLFEDIAAQIKVDSAYVKDLSIKADNVELPVLLAGPIGLVFHEMYVLASRNCYKRHACVITILLENIETSQVLTMVATGKVEDLVQKMNVESLGRDIISMLCEQIDAKFDFSDTGEFARWKLTYEP